MPIYGVDESLYQLTHKIEYLGSIINEETLRRVISHYIPGLDQLGDWSERQLVLFNGHKNEHGDTKHHLVKSREIIQKLRVINSQQSWYTKNFDEITKYELQKIDELL
jgi:hypothetical protein